MSEGRSGIVVGLAAAVAVAALAGWWWYARQAPEPPVAEPAAPPAAVPPAETGPRYPLPDEADGGQPALTPLPPLDDSDEYLRLDIEGLFGGETAELVVTEALVERLVATIDNLPRQRVAERVRPVEALPTPFAVAGQDGSGEFRLDEANYRRYDVLVERFAAADADRIVELYRRYYPLFQKAYVNLGYPNGYFNDRLVEVLDHLLETPDVRDAPLLVRPHVLYQYADPELEALSGGQKLLLRIGPAHRERVLDKLSELRARVANDRP